MAGNGWKAYTVARDTAVKRSGQASLRITASPTAVMTWPKPWAEWATVLQSFEAKPWLGQRIRLSAWVKAENVVFAAIWLRVDGDRMLQFDNMSGRPISGGNDWMRFDVVLDVPMTARYVSMGTILHGGGQVWADDFEIHVVDGGVPSTNQLVPADLAQVRRRNFTPDHPQATNRRVVAVPTEQPVNVGFEE